MKAERRYLLFDVMAAGHGVKNWLALLKSPEFADLCKAADVDLMIPRKLAVRIGKEWPEFFDLPIRVMQEDGLEEFLTRRGRDLALRLLRDRLTQVSYERVLLFYGDSLILKLLLCRKFFRQQNVIACVFRPIVHYRESGYSYGTAGIFERVCPWLKNKLLTWFLESNVLKGVVFQDEAAVSYYKRRGFNASWMPTPLLTDELQPLPRPDNARVRFLLFGSITRRKGALTIIDAWNRLTPEQRSKGQLQISGEVPADEVSTIKAAIDGSKPGITWKRKFLSSSEIEKEYEHCDVVLMIYNGIHVGTSGLLTQAAAWGRPVIATSSGWIGSNVNRWKLGTTVSPNPSDISAAMARAIDDRSLGLSSELAEEFARRHVPSEFGKRLVDVIEGKRDGLSGDQITQVGCLVK